MFLKQINRLHMKKYFYLFIVVLLSFPMGVQATHQPEFSTAGFFELKNSGRQVFSMNPAWRFYKGELVGAETSNFDDKTWTVVSLPHGIEYLPAEASGCINYQGPVWYRKHFTPDESLKNKKIFLYFEAIMGKSKVYLNGELLTEHFGGYLPVIADLTQYIKWGQDNIIAVCADNSDDPAYPPGKSQDMLDFTYFGGIYRDCWLIAHNDVYLTDPNYENEVAGGGLFVSFGKISDLFAEVFLKVQIRNEQRKSFAGTIEYEFHQTDGKQVAFLKKKLHIQPDKVLISSDKCIVKNPILWSPDSPSLYNLIVRVKDAKGNVVDGYRQRIGIRSLEFKGKDGFWLNGKPYETALIGANRHQDFALIGNALPNSLHWRDAKKLRDAGLRVIRNAHCPQDPAFMDACDELGLFVIVNTPGWQFWNDAPEFAQRVYSDIRNIVRRDRNHPSVWLWEPILNETRYPADFAKTAHDMVHAEYPYPYCYAACDKDARGKEYFSVLYAYPPTAGEEGNAVTLPGITYFTREWGDGVNVDDWSAQNSPNRAARNWGERPMLVQAQTYAKPLYDCTAYDALCRAPRQYVGGCVWHSFDHQRGYHPDPFYGGLMDVFRQPKYAYYMFMSQRLPIKQDRIYETGPMVYIANEMTPFSDKDVTVYSNCDTIRLTYNKGGETRVYTKPKHQDGMPSPIITFKNVFNFMTDKTLARQNKQEDIYLLAEGIMNGKVVATHKVAPARRPEKIILWVDNEGTNLVANGSDIVTVIAAVADNDGNIKRLNNCTLKFHIEGEGRILGGADIMANPVPVRWGTAPILVQSTLKPGKIRITVSTLLEGSQMPASGVLELESMPAEHPLIYNTQEANLIPFSSDSKKETLIKSEEDMKREHSLKSQNVRKLKEVEKQQEEFGER